MKFYILVAPTDRAPNGNAPEYTTAGGGGGGDYSNIFREMLAAASAIRLDRMLVGVGLWGLAWLGRREGAGAVGAFARWVTGKKGTIMR